MSLAEDTRIWTALSMVKWTTDYLAERGFENPRLNAEWILSHVLSCRRLDLYADFERPLRASELAEYKNLLKRRLRHEPLQYLTGETEFFGLRILVTPDVLIPRPDTEVLVEQTLEAIGGHELRPVRILEIGTGSGNIAIALAVALQKRGTRFQIDSVDVSAAALAVGSQNAALHGVEANIHFRHDDFLADEFDVTHPYDVIVSNPPYLSDTEYANTPDEVRLFEPRTALHASREGLIFYEKLAIEALRLMRTGSVMAVEAGYDQSQRVADLFREYGLIETEILNDYTGIPRVVRARMR